MSSVIHKYRLIPGSNSIQTMYLPKGAKILSVGGHNDVPFMWMEVESDQHDTEKRRFLVVGTGFTMELNAPKIFLGTVDLQLIQEVYHVFEILNFAAMETK